MNPNPRSRFRRLLRVCIATLPVSLVFPLAPSVFAADGTWNTTATGLLWSTPGNWVGSVADGAGFTANFNTLNPTVSTTVHLDSTRTIGNLVFGDTDTATAASWTLGNNGNAANILTLSGTTPTVTVNTLGASSLVTISAVIAGTDGLTKNGSGSTTTGILTLSGANTYSGGTTISTGSIRAQNNTALGTGAVTVASGARLQVSGGINLANTINLNGSSALYGNIGSNTLSGTVNVQSASTLALNAVNDNNLTLTGDLNLSSNTLTVTGVGNTNSFVTISGTINGSGGITKSGAGALTINGDQTSTYSGVTTLNGGTLAIGGSGALGTGNFSLGVNDNTVIVRSSGTEARTLGNSLTLLGNANTLFTFGSTNTSFNGGLTFSNTGGIALGSTRRFVINNTTRFDGGFTGVGSGLIMQTGTGTLVLAGTNTYTGATTVNAGTLLVNGSITGSGVTVNTASTFGGAGTVSAAATSNAGSFLSAGASAGAAGTLTFTSTLDVSGLAGGAGGLLFDLGAVGGSDKIVSGELSIGTGVLDLNDFNFTTLSGFGGGTYTLFDATSVVGTLGSNLTGTIGGLDAVLSISGNDLVLTVSAIPEPASFAVLAGGALLGFAVWRRRGVRR